MIAPTTSQTPRYTQGNSVNQQQQLQPANNNQG